MSEFREKYLKTCIGAAVIAVLLVIAFMLGGGGEKETTDATPTPGVTESPEDGLVFNEIIGLHEEPTPAPTPTPQPLGFTENIRMDPEVPKSEVCTVKVSFDASKADGIKEEKRMVLPEDGIILGETEVEILDGETAFDVLKNILTKKKIHLDFEKNATGGVYIKGIANLYERDGGEASGWCYKVNGEYSMVECTAYKVKSGDKIEWEFVQ